MRAALSGSGRAATKPVGAQEVSERNRSCGRGPRSGGDHAPEGRQRGQERDEIGGVRLSPVLGGSDDGDGLGPAQQALRLHRPTPDREGQGDGAEGGDGEVGDDGVAVVGKLDGDDVPRPDTQPAQAPGQTSDLAVESRVTEFSLGVEDRRPVQIGDLPGPEQAVEVEVRARAVHRP